MTAREIKSIRKVVDFQVDYARDHRPSDNPMTREHEAELRQRLLDKIVAERPRRSRTTK